MNGYLFFLSENIQWVVFTLKFFWNKFTLTQNQWENVKIEAPLDKNNPLLLKKIATTIQFSKQFINASVIWTKSWWWSMNYLRKINLVWNQSKLPRSKAEQKLRTRSRKMKSLRCSTKELSIRIRESATILLNK